MPAQKADIYVTVDVISVEFRDEQRLAKRLARLIRDQGRLRADWVYPGRR